MPPDESRPRRKAPGGGARFAEIALDRPLDQTFSYAIPDEMAGIIRVGSLVEVPLRKDEARGVVVGLTDRIAFRGAVKPILQILTPEYQVGPELLPLARWISEYYWCSHGEALATVSFIGLNDVRSMVRSSLALAHADHWLAVSRETGPEGQKVSAKQGRIIHALLARANEPVLPAELREEAQAGDSVIQTMLERKWLVWVRETVPREDDYPPAPEPDSDPPELTPRQQQALERILVPLNEVRHQTFLLHGVTGSGKTEVYLRAIAEGLRLGRTAIVLVPEISLTPQTVENFRKRLGNQVGVYHSRLTIGQKYDLWKKIAGGDIRVLIGARSAVLAPMPNLGIIVADEEHEAAFKQSEVPRYHARDVAVWRAFQAGAVTILGSATPSMESFHNAREGKYQLLELPERIGPHASAAMTIIDLKRLIAAGSEGAAPPEAAAAPRASSLGESAQRTLISPILRAAIERRLATGEQTVLLLNRRGFANQVLCFKCEKPLRCPHCDVSLTYHKRRSQMEGAASAEINQADMPQLFPTRGARGANAGFLSCHFCGYTGNLPRKCPNCGGEELHALGLGTQKVEELIREMFKEARILRVDVDSMKGRRTFLDAWERISRREVDIILGTQMIAKGFHLEAVTLVGVISADFALFLPDFRGAERTFQLLTQVAGRAGRGGLPGEVIVQSFIPHHYAIEHAARLDEKGFYEKELHIRKMLRFPPLHRLIALLAHGKDLPSVREQAGRLANLLKTVARRAAFAEVKVLGPAPAPLSKIEDQHRWRILLRGPRSRELHDLLREGLRAFEQVHEKSKVAVAIDVDPVDLL